MNKAQEKLLVATLCGLVVTAAAAFAVLPTMAAGPMAPVSRLAPVDPLDAHQRFANQAQQDGAGCRDLVTDPGCDS